MWLDGDSTYICHVSDTHAVASEFMSPVLAAKECVAKVERARYPASAEHLQNRACQGTWGKRCRVFRVLYTVWVIGRTDILGTLGHPPEIPCRTRTNILGIRTSRGEILRSERTGAEMVHDSATGIHQTYLNMTSDYSHEDFRSYFCSIPFSYSTPCHT